MACRDTIRLVLMKSRLKKPHGWFFSGISGGRIYVAQDDLMIPAGLLYDGWPQTNEDRHKQFTPNDLVIRGVTLTPTNFQRWLFSREVEVTKVCSRACSALPP